LTEAKDDLQEQLDQALARVAALERRLSRTTQAQVEDLPRTAAAATQSVRATAANVMPATSSNAARSLSVNSMSQHGVGQQTPTET
jgi:chromosome segregation ATPase